MKPVILTLTLALTSSVATMASAQDVCMPASEMKAALIDWYGERPRGEVTDANEQLWVSDQSGSWTMVKTFSDGNACVVATGDDWMDGLNQTELLAALDN